jgi:hypothetical protein
MLDNTALYNLLSELGVIDKKFLDEIFAEVKETGDPMDKILLERDLISDENLGVLVADKWGYLCKIGEISFKKRIGGKLPEEMCRAKRICFLKKESWPC